MQPRLLAAAAHTHSGLALQGIARHLLLALLPLKTLLLQLLLLKLPLQLLLLHTDLRLGLHCTVQCCIQLLRCAVDRSLIVVRGCRCLGRLQAYAGRQEAGGGMYRQRWARQHMGAPQQLNAGV